MTQIVKGLPLKEYQRRYYIERKHGIAWQEYDRLIARGCEICGRRAADAGIHLDHDHATNEIRGVLCGPCNRGLGMYRDDPDLLVAAAAYLLKSKAPKGAG